MSRDKKSPSAYVFMIAGGPVCWRSKKQTIVTAASCEAEYIASCSAWKEAVFLPRLIGDMCCHDTLMPIRVFADYQGSIAKNQAITQRNKHVDIQYHYVRYVVAIGNIEFVHFSTEDTVYDPLTKPLDRVKFEKLFKAIGDKSRNCPFPSIEKDC